MSKCEICLVKLGNKPSLQCSDCQASFHGACLKMSRADIECINADNLVWRCSTCASNRRKSMRFEVEATEGRLTLEDVMKVVSEIRDMHVNREKDMNKAYESLHEKITESTEAIALQTAKLDECLKKIDSLHAENSELKQKIVSLENTIEDMQQYSRANCLEIHGVPQQPNENVISVVKEVGKALDMPITDQMIDTCHRLGRRQTEGGRSPGIIVKFVRRLDKEEMLQKRRVKRTLSTRHMNLSHPTDQPIYVNESLTPARRRLFAMAREIKRSKNFKYLWVRGGKIFLRREENSPVIHVTSQADLSKL